MVSAPNKPEQGIDCPLVGDNPLTAYLELLKRSVSNLIYLESEIRVKKDTKLLRRAAVNLLNALSSRKSALILVDRSPVDPATRLDGRDWPPSAHTMVGLRRLDNIQCCLEQIFQDNIPGDVIEAGVWRGGASIFMRGVMRAHGEEARPLWLADSFAGLPPPNEEKYPADKGIYLNESTELAVSLEQVKANFVRYGLLDDNVHFLKGWFSETLPDAPIKQLALIRADGDLYESTWDILTNLYPRLSPGGFIIIDDFQIPACVQAVHDYRKQNGIMDEIKKIDWAGVYWRRSL